MSLAWHTAAMTRAKKLPPLSRLILKDDRKPRGKSWQEQLAAVTAFSVAFNQRKRK